MEVYFEVLDKGKKADESMKPIREVFHLDNGKAPVGSVRKCFLLKVKKQFIPEYIKEHENVWPEMRDALTRHGWHNYSLYLTDDGLLAGYVETPNWQATLDGMGKEEVNTRWQKSMAKYFECEDNPDENF
jgi:L-rhamnose mutarotase